MTSHIGQNEITMLSSDSSSSKTMSEVSSLGFSVLYTLGLSVSSSSFPDWESNLGFLCERRRSSLLEGKIWSSSSDVAPDVAPDVSSLCSLCSLTAVVLASLDTSHAALPYLKQMKLATFLAAALEATKYAGAEGQLRWLRGFYRKNNILRL